MKLEPCIILKSFLDFSIFESQYFYKLCSYQNERILYWLLVVEFFIGSQVGHFHEAVFDNPTVSFSF